MDEKPITDRENFPSSEPMLENSKAFFIPASALSPGATYNEGCADGYRKAIQDLATFAIIGMIAMAITARLYAAD